MACNKKGSSFDSENESFQHEAVFCQYRKLWLRVWSHILIIFQRSLSSNGSIVSIDVPCNLLTQFKTTNASYPTKYFMNIWLGH